MLEVEEKNWFKKHLFRHCLVGGGVLGGLAGWLVGKGNPEGTFIIIMGVFGGLFVGFLAAMFISD
ncbi:MAG: hypothetical protein JXB48_22085 [Candidatus Latescibacteria bacterium]|nr:hypothetical protein [Candidatus Latescibacterota bacterium]